MDGSWLTADACQIRVHGAWAAQHGVPAAGATSEPLPLLLPLPLRPVGGCGTCLSSAGTRCTGAACRWARRGRCGGAVRGGTRRHAKGASECSPLTDPRPLLTRCLPDVLASYLADRGGGGRSVARRSGVWPAGPPVVQLTPLLHACLVWPATSWAWLQVGGGMAVLLASGMRLQAFRKQRFTVWESLQVGACGGGGGRVRQGWWRAKGATGPSVARLGCQPASSLPAGLPACGPAGLRHQHLPRLTRLALCGCGLRTTAVAVSVHTPMHDRLPVGCAIGGRAACWVRSHPPLGVAVSAGEVHLAPARLHAARAVCYTA